MKTLTKPGKAFAATALAAAILLGGPAAAAMAENSEPVHLPGVTANSVLTEAITLKTGLGGAPIYDTINGTMTSGIGALFPSEAMSGVTSPASGPIMGDDGQTYRAIGLERCNLPVAMYYLSDIAVASSVARTDATDATYRAAAATDSGATQHAGVALHYSDAALPMLMPSSDVDAPGYVANSCIPNQAMPFTPEGNVSAYPGTPAEFAAGIVHKQMTAAATDAIADRSAARGAAELERAQTGYSESGADVVAASDIPQSVTSGRYSSEMVQVGADAYFAMWDVHSARADGTAEEIDAAERKAAETKAVLDRYQAASDAADSARHDTAIRSQMVTAANAAIDDRSATAQSGFQAPADVNLMMLAAFGFMGLLAAGVAAVVATVRAVRKYKAEEVGK